ncbi:hypothetical protein P280DRAFT_271361 [Massarina eburnea CBS 473.64]|uniref:Uncharacterized protein n=1 Tax=Massarina eburnea CBS 473.64 TaxID=1395130 RepID=A0A6A6S5Z0_9PLEO|nr:hypothetical protein P280DRAFT_271361 [Massarina eburnea CBS 473.64]
MSRNGSEASSSTHSLAYSFYELPDSRHSSSTYSYSDLEIPQYDGATASRLGSRGAYHSIRLPQQHRESSGTFLHPPPQSRAISPLPTNPYTRDVSGQHFLRPSPPPMSLFTADNLLGPEQDAVEAVGRNLSSPLDLVEERATSYFHRLSAQFQANQQQTHGMQQPIHPQHGFQQRQALQRQLALRQRHALQQAFHQQQQSDAYMIPARRSRMPGSGPGPGNPRYQQPLRVDNQYAAHRRDVPATRNGQRSSENVPVSSFTNIPALPARFSMPQPPRPRDMSNRPRIHSPRQDLAPPASFFPRAPSRGPPSTSTTLDLVSGVTSRRPTGYPAIARLESRNDG